MTYSSIGILINAEFYQTDKIVSCLEILVHYLNSNYHLSCAAALGTAAHSPALHPSYKNALTAAKYQYFLPQCSVITYEMIELRDLKMCIRDRINCLHCPDLVFSILTRVDFHLVTQ